MAVKYTSPCLLFFGALMFGASVFVGYYLVPYKIWENITEQSKIVLGNARFKSWERIPIPIFQHIYFFNVTNAEEVIDGEKPMLQEIGPYIYQMKREKLDILFNADNGTVFYRERTDFFFRPDLSNGSESDLITFVNIPYVSAAQKAQKSDFLTRYVIEEVLRKFPEEGLYLHLTIKELMFGGLYLPFLKELSDLNGKEVVPDNKFGLYYKRNGTNQGRFEVYTGVKHPEKFGEVASWDGMTSVDWWGDDEYCNRINGSDGGVFAPYADKDRRFYMFIPGLCKSFRFDFETDGIDVKGVPVNKYSISPSFLASAKTNPENACYCNESPENLRMCPEDGVLPLENCGKGVMVLSQPHFYQGSDLYLNQSVGLRPDKEKHEMALYIETYTSAPAQVKIRFQMNANLEPIKRLRSLKKIPRMIHPLFWIDQNVQIPDESASTLKNKLYGTIYIASILTHIGIVVGLALIIISLITFFMCTLRSPKKADQEKLECVSVAYHPQGTITKIPNGNLAFKTNIGKISNCFISFSNHDPTTVKSQAMLEEIDDLEREESVPFLQQNKPPPNPFFDPIINDNGDQHELIASYCIDDDDGYVTTSNSAKSCSNSSNDSDGNTQSLQQDSKDKPDSLLSPFPVVTDYSSSLSLGDVNNTPKDVVADASSSYENL